MGLKNRVRLADWSIEERSFDCVPCRAQTARRKKDYPAGKACPPYIAKARWLKSGVIPNEAQTTLHADSRDTSPGQSFGVLWQSPV